MKLLRNEKGITLAELLAVLAIGSLIMFLVIGLHVFIQKQYKSQSADVQNLTDITIAIKKITKDIRTAEVGEIEVLNDYSLHFSEREIKYVWDKETKILKENNVDYIHEIEDFNVTPNGKKKTGDG